MSLATVVIGLFGLVYAALAVVATRRPLLARLAAREAVRRPGQSAVVVLGLMVGTVTIFSSQVLGDSFLESPTQAAYLAWGRVDLVAANGGKVFDPALASGWAGDPRLRSTLANLRPLIGDRGVNVIRLAAPGEGRAELDRAHQLVPQVLATLQALPGGSSLAVRESKRIDVDGKTKQAEGDRSLFGGLSLFIALAGAALVVNLGLALSEERRPRHAVLRALGLTRTGMITLSVLEGALYSLAAAALALGPGTLFGVALVRILQGGSQLYAGPVETRAGLVLYSIAPGSVALTIAIGALIVLATLFATSIRSSRMQISAAIKNLPEPAGRRKPSIWRTALLAGLGLGSLAALVAGDESVRLAGGVGLVIVAAGL